MVETIITLGKEEKADVLVLSLEDSAIFWLNCGFILEQDLWLKER